MQRILVWTQKIDLHADLVIRELSARGTHVTRINGDEYPAGKTASIHFPGGTICSGPDTLVSSSTPFDAVWYRRRTKPVLDSRLHPQAKKFAADETVALLDGILLLTQNSFWVNSFASAQMARNKPWQLSVADNCGLTIPPTLISNDPTDVRAFAAQFPRIIYKPVYRGLVENDRDQDNLIFTNVLPADTLANADAEIKATPGIYQAYIPKQLELRLTVVGSQIFSCAIHSQEHSETRDDWRHYHAELRHTVFPLPRDVQKKILLFMHSMDLQFGTIDMVLTPDNNYVFLEINQMGQWVWIQSATGLPIAQALADLLLQKGGTPHAKHRLSARIPVLDHAESTQSCG